MRSSHADAKAAHRRTRGPTPALELALVFGCGLAAGVGLAVVVAILRSSP